MSEPNTARWEAWLGQTAQALPYPPTPDVASAVNQRLARPAGKRRLAWALAAVALALAGLMSVPQVRAAVAEIIRIGVVNIFPAPPSPAPTTVAPPVTATPAPGQPTLPARPSPTPYSLLDLAGEVTLDEARARSGLPIPLPRYPADLGQPDRVYLQDQNGPVVVLVWLNPKDPGHVRLSLHILAPGTWGVGKLQPPVLQETAVGGRAAIWAEGPYLMFVGSQSEPASVRLIQGHVLIWEAGGITYRLETDIPLEEAVRIAESLE